MIDIERKYSIPSPTLIRLFKSDGIFKSKNKRWSQSELSILRDYYKSDDWIVLFELLKGRSKDEIIHKAYKLGISRDKNSWSEADLSILKREYKLGTPISAIIEMLSCPRTPEAVYTKANALGLRMRNKWANSDIEVLRENYGIKSICEIEKMVPNMTRNTIKTYAHKYGLISKDWLNRCSSLESYRGISHYIRSNNSEWKLKSMKHCEYKCVLSGNRFDDVHHLVSFNKILYETMQKLNIAEKMCFSDYSDFELDRILSCFLSIQSTYPLGVCLSKDIHTAFHIKYGYGNNTPEQFNEFSQLYYTSQNPVTITAS